MKQRLMQGIGTPAHRISKNWSLLETGFERFRVYSEREPFKVPPRKASFQILIAFAKGHKAWIKPLDNREGAYVGDRVFPSIHNKGGSSDAAAEQRGDVNWDFWPG
jgi:hypothetical protein